MPLPKIETPKYVLKVPSTNNKIEYRPFLVKEEKVLLIAQESEDESQIRNAICDIVSACTFGQVDPLELTTYDLEYIFLMLRAKSVGETANFRLKCTECGEYTEYSLDLEKVKVVFPKNKPKDNISINGSIGMTLKPLKVKNMTNLNVNDINSMVSLVIDTIYDSDSVYSADNTSKKELDDFIDSLPHKALAEIQNFVENQPKLSYTVKFKCESCGAENETELTGLASFF